MAEGKQVIVEIELPRRRPHRPAPACGPVGLAMPGGGSCVASPPGPAMLCALDDFGLGDE
jgi:hypothetical protein